MHEHTFFAAPALLPFAIMGSQANPLQADAVIPTGWSETDWSIPPLVEGLVAAGEGDLHRQCPC